MTMETVWHMTRAYAKKACSNSSETLQDRFMSIRNPAGPSYRMVSAKKRAHVELNRYINIMPYDYNRIKVMAGPDGKGRFINASSVKSSSDDVVPWSYIATQGPLAGTVADFWHMVAEQQCSAIVMLTRCMEGAREKCFQYFPCSSGEALKETDISVTCVDTTTLGSLGIEVRTMRVERSCSDAFVCTHYLYKKWPDHGAPRECASTLALIDCVNKTIREHGGVACVHCSAGVGRTGSWIAIDVILQRLRKLAAGPCTEADVAAAMDVECLVEHLRTQRVGMVQQPEQVQFIYACLLAKAESELAPATS